MSTETTIDYLFEDPPIPNQQYALVSIVGPHMPQKCNVWGLKVRGTTDTLEKAKNMSQKLLKIDNNYDIYTVEVGKFFPLDVEPYDVKNIEYQNEQLNTLIKSYLENKESANEHWHQRNNEMVKEAIREGKSSTKENEHPISLLQQIHFNNEDIAKLKEKISELESDIHKKREKFNSDLYTEGDRANAEIEFNKMLKLVLPEIKEENEEGQEINDILERIKNLELEKTKLEKDEPESEEISRLDIQIKLLKEKLNDPDVINQYINTNYQNPQIKLV